MVVAVAGGLENLKSELRHYGFETVTYGEYHHRIDAIVYSRDMNIASFTNVNLPSASGGVLMVNVYGKSAKDIADILSRKSYSPLF